MIWEGIWYQIMTSFVIGCGVGTLAGIPPVSELRAVAEKMAIKAVGWNAAINLVPIMAFSNFIKESTQTGLVLEYQKGLLIGWPIAMITGILFAITVPVLKISFLALRDKFVQG